MTCMSYYPRSATVRAKTDCVMLEMLRNVLDILQRNKTFRAQLERNYRVRALDSHLRTCSDLRASDQGFRRSLARPGGVAALQPGPGDLPPGRCRRQLLSGPHRLRESFRRENPGGELVLAYLARGGYFGEIALLTGSPRTATCTALDHVEVVRISAEDFQLMLDKFPDVRAQPGGHGARTAGGEPERAPSGPRMFPWTSSSPRG